MATENFGGGKIAAGAVIDALNGRGNVAIIDHPEVESVILRTKGFFDEMNRARQEDNVQIEIAAQLPGLGSKDRSFKAVEDILQAHPNLDAFFAINDPSALGAVDAI